VNRALGREVRLENSYEWLTKGELVQAAASAAGISQIEKVIPHTFSCARANGHFFRGGSAYLNCGICVACMTRRGSIRTAELDDSSEYLIDRLQGARESSSSLNEATTSRSSGHSQDGGQARQPWPQWGRSRTGSTTKER